MQKKIRNRNHMLEIIKRILYFPFFIIKHILFFTKPVRTRTKNTYTEPNA